MLQFIGVYISPVKVRQLVVKETKWCVDKDPSLLLHRRSPASSRVQSAPVERGVGSCRYPVYRRMPYRASQVGQTLVIAVKHNSTAHTIKAQHSPGRSLTFFLFIFAFNKTHGSNWVKSCFTNFIKYYQVK